MSQARIVRRPVTTMKRRPEFLRIRGGARWSTSCFVVEAKPREPVDTGEPRIGYTVTKQLGNSPIRNRIRRRLREAMRLCDRALLRSGHDYVLIARSGTLQRGFVDLRADLEAALVRVGAGGQTAKPQSGRRPETSKTPRAGKTTG